MTPPLPTPPTPDAGHGMVLDLLLILAAATVVTMLLRRLRLATIPGYLITGALLGLTGLISGEQSVQSISDLAIILLMFTIGLHLDLDGIRADMVRILTVGVVSTLGVVLVGWPVAIGFGLSAPAALAAALALSMSSTAVVFRILQQRREMHRAHGRVCFGVLVVQDLLALAFLMILPPLAIWAGSGMAGVVGEVEDASPGPRLLRLAAAAGIGIGGIALMILIGRWAMPRLLQEAARGSSAEVPLVLASAAALGAAVVASLLGFSPELGAFLAGFILAATPFRHQLSGQLAPMRDLFMAVFFTAVGLKMDLPAVAQGWWIVALALIALIAIKAAVLAATTWLAGSTAPVAVASGFALAQAGEFSLVILGSAASLGIVAPDAEAMLIALVVLSLILTPLLYDLGQRIRPRFANLPTAAWLKGAVALREDEPGVVGGGGGGGGANARPHALPLTHHVIVAGFGIVARNLVQHFEAAGIPYVIIELNPVTVRTQRRLGRRIVFGDAANPEVLESAGLRAANAVVLTIPDDEAMLRACKAIRAIAPKVFIAARTTYLSRAILATELGADHVTVEEVATAESMAKQVVQRLFKHIQDQPQAWIPGAQNDLT